MPSQQPSSEVAGGHILVAGTAHADVISAGRGAGSALDRAGTTRMSVGGAGCNMAVNLRKSGHAVRLMTAMNQSWVSASVERYLQEQGVVALVDHSDELPDGICSVHVDEAGELASAVTTSPVEGWEFDQDAIRREVSEASAVVVDCNLSVAMLEAFGAAAQASGKPFYVVGVSEEKSLKIAHLSAPMTAIFMSDRELAFFRQSHFNFYDTSRVAEALKTTIVETMGRQGASVVGPDGVGRKITGFPGLQVTGNLLGATEALAARSIHFHLQGRPMHQAVEAGARVVPQVAKHVGANLAPADSFGDHIASLARSAHTDGLTGLANRTGGEAGLVRLGQKGGGLLALDIDRFKLVNDTFGHGVGDRAIQAIADAIRSVTRRDSDVVPYRLGGDEFVVVLPAVTPEDVAQIAERIRATVEERGRTVVAPDHPITVSVGGTVCDPGEEMAEVLERADRALYQAKRAGRNAVQVDIPEGFDPDEKPDTGSRMR